MQQIKQTGSMITALAAVFLFTYSVSMAEAKSGQQSQSCTISKHGSLPVNPDNQFPFEEKEEEASDESQDGFSLVYIPAEPIAFISFRNQPCIVHQTSYTDDILQQVPIYLAQRALIIWFVEFIWQTIL